MAVNSLKTFLQNRSLQGEEVHPQPCVHPFFHRINLTAAQKIQVAVMSFTVAPVRLLLASFFLFLTWAWAYVVTYSMVVGGSEPPGFIRGKLLKSVRFLARCTLFFGGFHRITTKGKQASAAEAPILIAAPHSTMLDAVVVFASNDLPSPITKSELESAPIVSTILKVTQPVFVYRHDLNSRKRTIDEISRRAGSGGKWPQVLVFPEGTCGNSEVLLSFKTGGFASAVPVQPVAIRYPNTVNTLPWTENGPDYLKILWLTLCQFETKSEVHFLPVYTPNEKERKDPKLFADNVRRSIADEVGLPCTRHTFEDCRLLRLAGRLGLPMDASVVEFHNLRQETGKDIRDVEKILEEFASIVSDKQRGLITIADLAKFLSLPILPCLEELFSLYDKDGTGEVCFREYVIGLSLVCESVVNNESLRWAFDILDTNSDGVISEEEFGRALQSAFAIVVESDVIFEEALTNSRKNVTFEEFSIFAKQRPEYLKLFLLHAKAEKLITKRCPNKCATRVSNKICNGTDYDGQYILDAEHITTAQLPFDSALTAKPDNSANKLDQNAPKTDVYKSLPGIAGDREELSDRKSTSLRLRNVEVSS